MLWPTVWVSRVGFGHAQQGTVSRMEAQGRGGSSPAAPAPPRPCCLSLGAQWGSICSARMVQPCSAIWQDLVAEPATMAGSSSLGMEWANTVSSSLDVVLVDKRLWCPGTEFGHGVAGQCQCCPAKLMAKVSTSYLNWEKGKKAGERPEQNQDCGSLYKQANITLSSESTA